LMSLFLASLSRRSPPAPSPQAHTPHPTYLHASHAPSLY
jgi:hypothetical protein